MRSYGAVEPRRYRNCVVGFGVARYIIVVVAMATAISLLAQQISSIKLGEEAQWEHGLCPYP